MRRTRALRMGLTVIAVTALGGLALVACNGIVGVEDVRLRKDSGGAADVSEEDPFIEDDSGPTDSGIQPGPNVLEVALGLQHTCAKKPDGTVKCWGDTSHSQSGTGSAGDGGLFATPQIVDVNDALHIAAGQYHTCIVRTSGKVACWGENADGQIGTGVANGPPITKPTDVGGISDAIGITCGASFTCALRSGGGVLCWGNGLGGQLGTGTKQIQPSPVAVSTLPNAVAISAGESHACAVKADGKVACWGDNVNGQLGSGDLVERTTPTVIASLDAMGIVASAARSTCAAKKTGGVFCWGANEIGQLGSGAANPTPNPSPTAVSGLDAIALWAGSIHACAVRRGGAVACWGAGFQGQIGDGQPRALVTTPTASPTAVSGISNAIGVGTGGNHSCAPTAPGGILCWGENLHGELGKGVAGGQLRSPESVLTYP